ncbi:MAG: diacylglycerol kinase family protein [Chitinophagaceae bacterium]
MNLLFIINHGSGRKEVNYPDEIRNYFEQTEHEMEIYELPANFTPAVLKNKIDTSNATRVVAVGGDGTIRLVAECILGSEKSMAIIPGGSANGLAKELGVPLTLNEALTLTTMEESHPVHLTMVNDHLCIHLSDIGFNAFVVKKFEDEKTRGMWGYIRAAFKTLLDTPHMEVTISTGSEKIRRKAAMVVIANGTRYGSGALINPEGRIDDDLFEIVIVRKISFSEIFKMMVTHRPYDSAKTEIFQSNKASINSRKKVHFQVDGEYLGKINSLNARLLKNALRVVIPDQR